MELVCITNPSNGRVTHPMVVRDVTDNPSGLIKLNGWNQLTHPGPGTLQLRCEHEVLFMGHAMTLGILRASCFGVGPLEGLMTVTSRESPPGQEHDVQNCKTHCVWTLSCYGILHFFEETDTRLTIHHKYFESDGDQLGCTC